MLAAWLAGLHYVVEQTFGTPETMLTGSDGGWHWLYGAVVAAVLLLIFTRGPEEDDRDRALMRRMFLLGPALPILSIYSVIATAIQTRWYGEPPLSADGHPPWPGPHVPTVWRRTAAVPLLMVGDAIFRAELASIPLSDGLAWSGETAFFLVGAFAVYVFTVAGPRIVAGATLSPWPWLIRFALCVAALVLGYSVELKLDGYVR